MVAGNLKRDESYFNKEKRRSNLEALFLNWADTIEENFFNEYGDFKNFKDNKLTLDLENYQGQLKEITLLDVKYKAFTTIRKSNIDFLRAKSWLIIYIYSIKDEISRRKVKKSYY